MSQKLQLRTGQRTPSAWNQWTRAGFFDPNIGVSQQDLSGTINAPGYLAQMRTGHPVISSLMNTRKAFIQSLGFEFSGPGGDRLTEYWKTKVMTGNNDTTRHYSFSEFLSDMMDSRDTYGFSLHECHMDPTLQNASTYLYPISPLLVYRFIESGGQVKNLEAIEFFNNLNYTTLPSSYYVHFALDPQFSNNWWGLSCLRPLVERWLVYKRALATYEEIMPLERGILYAGTVAGEAGTTEEGKLATQEFLLDVLEGKPVTTHLDAATTLNLIQSGSSKSSTDEFLKYSNDFNDQVRALLGANLDSLTLASHGSRALGETISLSDEKKYEAWIEAALADVQGSSFFRAICDYLGVDSEEIEIISVGVTDTESTLNIANIMMLLDKGIITVDQLGEDNIKALVASTGLSVESLKLTPAIPVEGTPEALTYAPTPEVAASVASGLRKLYTLPVSERPAIPQRDINLLKKIQNKTPLTYAEIMQWAAMFDDLDQNDPASVVTSLYFGGRVGNAFVDAVRGS